ncbi:hypothetical protein tloyanaT_31440 [Thalassotalea loyana]|uniref:DUF3299 domain-containing protein n=1 Tax=Thalassotalea loyana TaxID=280483 RepID=A0ABQ6HFL8_9GAMM|nr:DUF3299 domain-containing protein [Thalassotalea loyana]GLX86891.1 hypothetical protein tloyanaT_31440 [Thalassotalea loyana]
MRQLFIALFALSLFACEKQSVNQATDSTVNVEQSKVSKSRDTNKSFETIEWVQLIPADDLEILLNPPEYLMNIPDGSFEDQISSSIQNAMIAQDGSNERYEQALMSTRVIPEMDGKDIKIPGFVVPVEVNEEQKITSFFLVPFFGACLHAPPPPPNQIIYIEATEGVEIVNLYDAVWVSGKLSAEMFEDQIATSAYTMQLDNFEYFYEPTP